jgi:cysteine-rich repeat protein
MKGIRSWACLALFALALGSFANLAFAAKPQCNNGICEGNESSTCPQDCTAPPPTVCGDGICEGSETCSSCSTDCGVCPPAACNFDGICNAGEDCTGCSDCPGKTGGNPKNRYCCGADNYCNVNVCGANACDAVPVCGNGLLEYSEECDDGNLDNGDGCDVSCTVEPPVATGPMNQFNIGDSIGEGEAANGTLGAANHDKVWSTGYNTSDGVNSLNERFAVSDPSYTPNSSALDPWFNQAVSGDVMADFVTQAQAVVAAAGNVPSGQVSMVTMLLGNNDVCADSMAQMTPPATFEAQYRAGLNVLAAGPVPQNVNILISSLPAIYWLWESKRSDFLCRVIIWPFVPCQNLLDNPSDDCESAASRQNPDNNNYAGDGANCKRRKTFHALIRDVYNPILEGVLAEYQAQGKLPNAEFVDIFDVRFSGTHVNNGDCFHPSTAGHSLLATEQWCRSSWGADDAVCGP